MRWWLALAFAAIAALTALSVAEVFNARAERALREHGENLALGQSLSWAHSISNAMQTGGPEAIDATTRRSPFAIWAFSPDGSLLTEPVSRGARFENVPGGSAAVRSTLANARYVRSINDGKTYLIGLRLRDGSGAVITYIQRPELQAQLGIVHDQILRAALLAVMIGALVGLLVASLIAARLRRIARAAAEIEAGAFDTPLRPRFHDELGSLAETIDQMRLRLRSSFRDLEAERDRLRQLLEGLHEGVIALDRELRIVFWNGAARSIFEEHPLESGEPLPEPWPHFPLRTFAERLFDGTTVLQARVLAGERVFALTGIPAGPGASDAILVAADISERERRERAEREFVTNAAHELGTPLTAIRASLEVLQGGAKEDAAERDRFLSLIERQTLRLSRLRRALLALARAQTRHEPLRLEAVPLGDLLERVAAEAGTGDVELTVEADEELAAFAHPELLEQIVFNLVENALHHADATEIELAASRLESGLVGIEVRDDGKGIAAEERERLFDRFYRGSTEREDGFGLGLAIVREAVRAVGGTIRVSSGADGGTIVSVVLAAAESPVAPAETQQGGR
jgi:two-component system phosphate regulon sensor histidine kinase PhoR